MKSILTKKQVKTENVTVINSELYPEYNGCTLKINIRYDDECKNGHNTFSITGACGGNFGIGGCIHDFIIEQAPHLKKYIKWHLMSSEGPMHYVSNSLYHASDKDCWGKSKGEPYNYKKKLIFKGFPFSFELDQKFIHWLEENKPDRLTILELKHVKEPDTFSPNYTFKEYVESQNIEVSWYNNLFRDVQEAGQMKEALLTLDYSFESYPTSWGKGKEPDLEAARNSAIWPDAELKDFTKANLENRLPELLEAFKKDMEELGFNY